MAKVSSSLPLTGNINHNDTKNIQGGTTTERYHLTEQERDNANDVWDIVINSPQANKIIHSTGITSSGLNKTVNPLWEWIIANIPHSNTAAVTIPFPLASSGYKRIDKIVADTNNSFIRVPGEESISSPVAPETPSNSIEVTIVLISDSEVGEPSTPIVGDEFVLKAESVDFLLNTTSAIIDQVNLVDDRSSLSLSGAITDLKSVYIPEEFIRPGKPFFFINKTTHSVKLWNNAGTGNVKFKFPNNSDLVTKPNEVIQFRVNSNDLSNISLESVGASIAGVMVYKGSVANYAALPSVGLTVGDLYNVTDTGHNYVWSGVFWDDLGPAVDISGKEDVINKVSVIAGNESNIIKYPNTKAVSDADILVFNNSKAYTDSKLSATYAKIVYVNAASPTTATIFSLTNPPTVNDNSLKNDVQNLYIGTDSSTWVYQTSPAGYITKTGLGGDMTTNTPQTVTALKTFLNGMFGLRNVANTFTSFFTTAATAARTWTFPDKNGTVAMTSDIIAQLSGTVNRLVKFGTTTTGVDSRITDTGTYIGIDTINTPTKDITLGYQSDKEIGVEQSESTTVGRTLVVSAGRTIDFQLNGLLIPSGGASKFYGGLFKDPNSLDMYCSLYGTGLSKRTAGVGIFSSYTTSGGVNTNIWAGCKTNSGDIYIAELGSGSGIWKQTGGIGAFVLQTSGNKFWRGLCSTPNGDVYATVSSYNFLTGGAPGDIYKQTGGTGSFVAMGFTLRDYTAIESAPNGDVYVTVLNGSIYKIANGTSVLTDLLQTSRNWSGVGVTSGGDVYACVRGGDIYSRIGGAGNFNPTGQISRSYDSLSISSNDILYTSSYNGDFYTLNLNSTGTVNLNGGTLKLKAGTGKGTGSSKVQIITGQKTVSGTNMQVEVVRAEFDENGSANFFGAISQMNQLEVSGAVTATEDMNGKEVTFIGNGSLTIPSTLSAQWNIDLCADGATITWILGSGLTWRVAGIAAGTAPASVTDGQFCQVSRRIGTNEIRVRGI